MTESNAQSPEAPETPIPEVATAAPEKTPPTESTPTAGRRRAPDGRQRSHRRRRPKKTSDRVHQLDLKEQHGSLKRELAKAIAEVVTSGQFILGPKVAAFEKEIADYVRVTHAVGVASGTDALILALRALDIGPGDEVITSAYSFTASVGAIELVGARPILVDIDLDTYNLNVDAVGEAVTDRTKAVLPVHLFGQCADMKPLVDLAARRNLSIVEDAAQALGAEHDGAKAGSMGTLGCFSFYPTKNLGGMGDGGMVVTSDAQTAERLRLMRVHGAKPKYNAQFVGTNSRLDALQAAILSVKFRNLEKYHESRRRHAHGYSEALRHAKCTLPVERQGNRHVYNQYAVRLEDRERIARVLKLKGIETAVYYPVPLHMQPAFAHLGYAVGQFPNAEQASRDVLCLPIYPELSKRSRSLVVAQLIELVGSEALPEPAPAPITEAPEAPAIEAPPAPATEALPAPATEASEAPATEAPPAPSIEAPPVAAPESAAAEEPERQGDG